MIGMQILQAPSPRQPRRIANTLFRLPRAVGTHGTQAALSPFGPHFRGADSSGEIMIHSRFTLSLCLALAGAAIARPAHANDCTSATPILVKLWDKFEEAALNAGCAVVGGLVTPPAAPVASKACDLAQPGIDKIINAVIAKYNKATGENPGKLGPRLLKFGSPVHGKLVSIGERLFASALSATHDTVTVKLTRLAGDEKVNFIICRSEQNGDCTIAAKRELDGEAVKAPVEVKVTGMRGKILVVHLAAAKVNLKSFEYELVAKQD